MAPVLPSGKHTHMLSLSTTSLLLAVEAWNWKLNGFASDRQVFQSLHSLSPILFEQLTRKLIWMMVIRRVYSYLRKKIFKNLKKI